MKRTIKKVAILGSGVMGSAIACHFANVGIEVLLLDIPPKELDEKEKSQGKELSHPAVRNRIVNNSLAASLKSKPSPIYHQKFSSRMVLIGYFRRFMPQLGTRVPSQEATVKLDWLLSSLQSHWNLYQAL